MVLQFKGQMLYILSDVVNDINTRKHQKLKGSNTQLPLKEAAPLGDIQTSCCRVFCFHLKMNCPCCKKKKASQRAEKNYRELTNELNISYILKQLRLHRNLLKRHPGSTTWSRMLLEHGQLNANTSSSASSSGASDGGRNDESQVTVKFLQ